MVLLIDHNDSFTNLLADLFRQHGAEVDIVRYDVLQQQEFDKYTHFVFGPGPGKPADYPESIRLIASIDGRNPILGVCLGMQMINEVERGKTIPAKRLMHGKTSTVELYNKSRLFVGLPSKIEVARYHSLAVEVAQNSPLRVTATAEDGEIMAVENRHWNDFGVQFHPESFMTENGKIMVKNVLELK